MTVTCTADCVMRYGGTQVLLTKTLRLAGFGGHLEEPAAVCEVEVSDAATRGALQGC